MRSLLGRTRRESSAHFPPKPGAASKIWLSSLLSFSVRTVRSSWPAPLTSLGTAGLGPSWYSHYLHACPALPQLLIPKEAAGSHWVLTFSSDQDWSPRAELKWGYQDPWAKAGNPREAAQGPLRLNSTLRALKHDLQKLWQQILPPVKQSK